jgi:hypothetical protein
MALPKLEVPTYELELPISKKTIKYRPFLVKEQKILLMAMESKDSKTIQSSILDVLNTCILTPEFNISSVPIIDIEYLFLQLRAKSVGEIVESKYRCNNEVIKEDGNTKECGNIIETKINLTQILPVQDKIVDPEIHLTEKIVIKMKYPEFRLLNADVDYSDVASLTFKMIASCIEHIFDGEQFYYSSEISEEELIEFVENLNQEQFEKLEEFFNNMPRMTQKIQMTCKKCGYVHNFEVEGLEDFFG